jgi:hypothetical protein
VLRRAFDWVFRSREDGRIVVAQLPNVPLGIFLVTAVVDRLVDLHGGVATAVHAVGGVALAWWATDELVRGVNPFRRALGAVMLALLAKRLLG